MRTLVTLVALVALAVGGGGACMLWWWADAQPSVYRRVAFYYRPRRTSTVSGRALPALWDGCQRAFSRLLELLGSRGATVRRRQRLAGEDVDLNRVRLTQLAAAGVGAVATAALTAAGALRGLVYVPGAGVLTLVVAVVCALAVDYRLGRRARSRQQRLARELPDATELLALVVGAGEEIGAAIARVGARMSGPCGQELRAVGARTGAGMPLVRSLRVLEQENDCPALSRLVSATLGAIEHGTPVADVLRAQALDTRATARRALMESGGKKEIAMLVPVVFFIMPLTVIFALYPGLLVLRVGV